MDSGAARLLNLKAETTNAHSKIIYLSCSPDGTKIVSGSTDKTIKVWDAGMQWAQKPPFTPPADASCLRTQPRSTW